jgi:hypothetical protein
MARTGTYHTAAPRSVWQAANAEETGMCEYCDRYVRFVVREGWVHAED